MDDSIWLLIVDIRAADSDLSVSASDHFFEQGILLVMIFPDIFRVETAACRAEYEIKRCHYLECDRALLGPGLRQKRHALAVFVTVPFQKRHVLKADLAEQLFVFLVAIESEETLSVDLAGRVRSD